jgi:catechol 2,3-dioxygenase-like lactoylglutathione lyase family enzyme
MSVYGIDHVQLAIPPGTEHRARAFYVDVLGLTEVPRPDHLRSRGGASFEAEGLRLHLGVDKDFVPARKAHPAFLVRGLNELISRCEKNGCPVHRDMPVEGFERVYIFDPLANRIELLEPLANEGGI